MTQLKPASNGYKETVAALRAKIRASKAKIARRKEAARRAAQEAYGEEFMLQSYERLLRDILE